MNLIKNNWQKVDYQEFQKYLFSFIDPEYQKFHSHLVPGNHTIIGVRIPILKKMAKEISKGNYEDFIKQNTHSNYEEITIHGLILGYLKIPFKELLNKVEEFIPFIDNWATNDVVCANLKTFQKNQEEGYEQILRYISSHNPWSIRFGLVLLLNHYMNDYYIDSILELCNGIQNEEYYVKMANAWLLSICYVHYPIKTTQFFLNNQLDNWTHNKAIQKTRESQKVSKESKEYLKTLKR